jgi:hypothetical protein
MPKVAVSGRFRYIRRVLKTEVHLGYPLAKPKISAEEMERRREAVRQADANNRIEGIFCSPESDQVFEAYIRGEIESDEIWARVRALETRR